MDEEHRHENGYDMTDQVHIVFAKPAYDANNPTFLDSRTFAEIRRAGLLFGSAESVENFSIMIVHELSHAVSQLRDRSLGHYTIEDGLEIIPKDGVCMWIDINRAHRGEFGRYSPLSTAYTYEMVFKLLNLTRLPRRSDGVIVDVSWQFGSVHPAYLLSVGPNGKLYTFEGEYVGFLDSTQQSSTTQQQPSHRRTIRTLYHLENKNLTNVDPNPSGYQYV